MARLTWLGPFRIGALLAACLDEEQAWPPASRAVYVISRRPWTGAPTIDSSPLYAGGNTGQSNRFCTRVGDLIADMHGLCDGGTGHHSGGMSLYEWCAQTGVHPGKLFIGWMLRTPWCSRCAELQLLGLLTGGDWSRRQEIGILNKKRPPACPHHRNHWLA
jgi:hypothetical protein